MKIAFLSTEYPTATAVDGGLASYLKKTAAALAQRGCEVWILVASQRNAQWRDGAVNVCEVRQGGIPAALFRIPVASHLAPALLRLRAAGTVARAFWKLQRRVGFDIVQSSNYLAPGHALLGNGQVPLVTRISSYQPLLLAEGGTSRSFAQYLEGWLELRQVLSSDGVFAPSRYLADYFVRLEGCHPEVIRTPLDFHEVAPDLQFFEEHRPASRYLLCFGTLNHRKGSDLLAQALPPLLARHPELGCVVMGRDAGLPCGTRVGDLLRDSCRDFLPRLQILPAQEKSRLYPFVTHAEAVLLPSRNDNYPNASLEALMLGTPVIGSDRSSIEEVVTDGGNGFLFSNGDAGSLEAAIERRLNQSPQEREAMSAAVRASVQAIRCEDRVGQLLAYYETVIQRFDGKRGRGR